MNSWYSEIGEYGWGLAVLGVTLVLLGFAGVIRAFTKGKGGRRR